MKDYGEVHEYLSTGSLVLTPLLYAMFVYHANISKYIFVHYGYIVVFRKTFVLAGGYLSVPKYMDLNILFY